MLDSATESDLQIAAVSQLIRKGGPTYLVELFRLMRKGGLAKSVHKQMLSDVRELYDTFRTTDSAAWNTISGSEINSLDFTELERKLAAIELPVTKSGKPDKRWDKACQDSLAAIKSSNWESFLSKGLVRGILSSGTFYGREIEKSIYELYSPYIARARASLLRDLHEQTVATYAFLNLFSEEFGRGKRKAGFVHFSDIKESLAAARIGDSMEDLYYRLDNRVNHVLLDEFQDTSLFEWQIIEPIVEEVLSHAAGERSFFCVGDVKQAIYGWRGGLAEIFVSLKERFPILEETAMSLSYRSAPAVIEAVNCIFGNLKNNDVLDSFPEVAESWSGYFVPHESFRENQKGYVAAHFVPETDDSDSPEDARFQYAAKLVQELLSIGESESIAILFRKNQSVSRMLRVLGSSRWNIDASEEGGNPLSDSLAVRLITTLLHFIDHPGDSIAFFRLQNSPFNELNLNGAPESIAARLRSEVLRMGLANSISKWVALLRNDSSLRDRMRLTQLEEMAFSFEASGFLRVSEFCEFVEKTKVEGSRPARVRVMTIHQAKGLEFSHVVLPELEVPLSGSVTPKILSARNGPLSSPHRVVRFPNSALRLVEPSLEKMYREYQVEVIKESLSLLYVAMTRAESSLQLVMNVPSKKERAIPKTFAGILRAGFLADLKEGLAFEIGEKPTGAKSEPRVELETRDRCSNETFSFQKKNASRRYRKQRASGKTFACGDLNGNLARTRGSVLHRFFQEISWLEEGFPERESLLELMRLHLARNGLPRDCLNEEIVDDFFGMLDYPDVRIIFERERHAPNTEAEREVPFAYIAGDTLFSGVIDRLHVVRDSNCEKVERVDIYDFKSDQIASHREDLFEEHRQMYASQIQIYKDAVSRLHRGQSPSIQAKLVFLCSGRVCEL